ncbi:MAG: hypothetical protein RL138_1592 [Bacteroidota bacterium]|jgi:hypothetical protein
MFKMSHPHTPKTYFQVLAACLLCVLAMELNSCKPKIDDRDFAISDTAAIQKIFLADKGNRNVVLERRPSGQWFVNGKFPVRHDAIRLLLQTMHDLHVNRPVSLEGHNNVVQDMAGNAIKVQVFGKDGSAIKTYFVGGVAKDYQGNYYLMEGAEQPYIVDIPGFDGYLSVRYILDEMDWRDRCVMALQPSEIARVSVQYLDERAAESYAVTEQDLDHFTVETPAKPGIQQVGKTKNCFILYEQFKELNGINYARNRPLDDSAKHRAPFAILKVQAKNKKVYTLKLVHADVTERSKQQFDPNGRPMSFDSEVYYVWVDDNKDLLLMQDFALRWVLVSNKEFIQ